MRELVIATKNEKKLRELRRYLRGVDARIVSLKDFDKTPRIVENAGTFRGNAVKKALKISKFTGALAIADDSGLAVDALGGLPGVRSSRFAGSAKSDAQNTRKLLAMLEGIPRAGRKASFVCAVAICDKGKVIRVYEERCEGLIASSAKGRHGFGYDPVFLIPKYGETFGQLGLKVKDKMSHRAKALKKAREFLKGYLRRDSVI